MHHGDTAADNPNTLYLPPHLSVRRIHKKFKNVCKQEARRRAVDAGEVTSDDEDIMEDDSTLLYLRTREIFDENMNVRELQYWSYTNFCKQWRKYFKHVKFFHTVWGQCDVCRKFQAGVQRVRVNREVAHDKNENRNRIDTQEEENDNEQQQNEAMQVVDYLEAEARCAIDAAAEQDEDEVIRVSEHYQQHRERRNEEWSEHLNHAQELRHYYKNELDRSTEICRRVREGELNEEEYVPHFTFDFAASLWLPQEVEKETAFDFNDIRNVRCFGIREDGQKFQHNQVFWEYITSGNANSTISLLDRYLRERVPQKRYKLMSDSTCKENRNNAMMKYHAFRVLIGEADYIEYVVFVGGHSHNVTDGCFGVIKVYYRKSRVMCMEDLLRVCNQASPHQSFEQVNEQHFLCWTDSLGQFFNDIPRISSYNYFEFERAYDHGRLVGVNVKMRRREDDDPVVRNSLKPIYRDRAATLVSRELLPLVSRELPRQPIKGLAAQSWSTMKKALLDMTPPEYHAELIPEDSVILGSAAASERREREQVAVDRGASRSQTSQFRQVVSAASSGTSLGTRPRNPSQRLREAQD